VETGYRERSLGEREGERESVLLCCLAENWTEEGELQCGCPHNIYIIYLTMFKLRICCAHLTVDWQYKPAGSANPRIMIFPKLCISSSRKLKCKGV